MNGEGLKKGGLFKILAQRGLRVFLEMGLKSFTVVTN